MSARHTLGPICTDEPDHDQPYQDIKLQIGAHTVATVWIDDAPVHDYNREQWANARRLVACWNACQSVPTDVLEAGLVSEQLWVQLTAQRDELLAALRKCRDMVGHPDNVAFIDAAIAKATGQQP